MYKNCSVGLQVRVYKCYIDLPGNEPADDNLRWKLIITETMKDVLHGAQGRVSHKISFIVY